MARGATIPASMVFHEIGANVFRLVVIIIWTPAPKIRLEVAMYALAKG